MRVDGVDGVNGVNGDGGDDKEDNNSDESDGDEICSFSRGGDGVGAQNESSAYVPRNTTVNGIQRKSSHNFK